MNLSSLGILPATKLMRSLAAFAGPREVFWIGDTRWDADPVYRRLLFDAQGLRLDEWRQEGLAALVKNGAGRTIHRVRLPGLDLYVKHFRPSNTASLFHQFFRQGRAQKEYQLAQYLRERGVATIRPIALGERWRAGLLLESFLLTEAISDGMTLFDLIERCVLTGRVPLSPRLRFHIAEELGALAAQIHSVGVEHRDLHERNIIVQPRSDGLFRFFMLDLHELRMRRTMSWRNAARDLARMGRYFTLRTSTADRRRFFRAYSSHRQLDSSRVGVLARALESETVESRADFWRRRDTRSFGKGTRMQDVRMRGARAVALQELPEPILRDLMHDLELPFRHHVVRWWKLGRATRVAEVELPAIRRGESLIYKQYHFKGWHETLATVLRPNQATRAWNNGAALLLRELPTPRPLALIHRTWCGLAVTSVLVTERVRGGLGLRHYIEDKLVEAEAAQRRPIVLGVLSQAAFLLRKLHDRRVTHRDLKASNVLASPTDDPARPQLWLIDLDGVQTWRRVPETHRVQNLVRFHVSFCRCPWISLSDKLRFLRLYLGLAFNDRKRWKTLWRAIAKGTQDKIRRNTRRGRQIL